VCRGCRTALHLECWAETTGCPTPGCARRPRPERRWAWALGTLGAALLAACLYDPLLRSGWACFGGRGGRAPAACVTFDLEAEVRRGETAPFLRWTPPRRPEPQLVAAPERPPARRGPPTSGPGPRLPVRTEPPRVVAERRRFVFL